jgi:hypothetical protein
MGGAAPDLLCARTADHRGPFRRHDTHAAMCGGNDTDHSFAWLLGRPELGILFLLASVACTGTQGGGAGGATAAGDSATGGGGSVATGGSGGASSATPGLKL